MRSIVLLPLSLGACAAGAAFCVTLVAAETKPATAAPAAEPAQNVKGVRIEVEPWYTSTISVVPSGGAVCAVIAYVRVTGIPAGMEVETITIPEGRLIRGDRTIAPLSETQLNERGIEVPAEPGGTAADWFRVGGQTGRGGLRSATSPYFEISYEELTGMPTGFEGTVRVQLKRARKISETPLEPGIFWSGGADRAEIVSVGHEGATLAVRLKLESGPADPGGKSVNPPNAEPLRLRLHQVPLNQWIDLTTFTPDPGGFKFTGAGFSGPGESFSILPQEDPARSPHEQLADYRLEFDQITDTDQLPPLVRARFHEGFSDAGAWQLEVEARATFVAEMPIRLASVAPAESSWRKFEGAGGPSQALADALAACVLREPAKPKAVDEYVRTLFGIIGRGLAPTELRRFDNTILLKLAAVGPSNLEALCRWGLHAGEPPVSMARSHYSNAGHWLLRVDETDYRCSQIRRVLTDLAEPRHKDLILRYHTPQFDLLDAIRERGWVEDALPGMCAFSENEPVPESWTALFVARPGPRTDAAILAQCRLGAMSVQQLAQAAMRPAGGLQPAIAAEWRAATDRTIHPGSFLHIFALACKHGLPEIPGDLRVLLDAKCPIGIQESDYESSRRTLVDVFALHSSCPADSVAAQQWLAQYAAQLHFNPDTLRYEPR